MPPEDDAEPDLQALLASETLWNYLREKIGDPMLVDEDYAYEQYLICKDILENMSDADMWFYIQSG